MEAALDNRVCGSPLLSRFEIACVVYSELTERSPSCGPHPFVPALAGETGTAPVGPCDTSAVVLYSFLYVIVRFLLETLIVRGQSEVRLRAEVLACATSSRCWSARLAGRAGSPPIAWCWLRSAVSCPGQTGDRSCPHPRPCSAGIGNWSGASGPLMGADPAGSGRWSGA